VIVYLHLIVTYELDNRVLSEYCAQ